MTQVFTEYCMTASWLGSLECRNCDIVPVDITLGVCRGELVAQVELSNMADEVVLPDLRVQHETLGHETIDQEERPSLTPPLPLRPQWP